MQKDTELESDRLYLAFRGYGYSDKYEQFGESDFIRGTVRLTLKWPFFGRERFYQVSVSGEDFACLERTFYQKTAKDAADWADEALKRHGISQRAVFKDKDLAERFYRNLK